MTLDGAKDLLPIENVGDYVTSLMEVAEKMVVIQSELEAKVKKD